MLLTVPFCANFEIIYLSFFNIMKTEIKNCCRLVYYTAIISVVTQRISPQTAAENRTTFLALCVCGPTNKPIMYKKLDNT